MLLLRIILALCAGLILSLGFEPVAWGYVMPPALAGFALATRDLRARRAWIPGLAFGIAFYFLHIYWMRDSIGTDAWLALASIEAVFYALLGAASPALQRLPWWPVWLAAAWTSMELLRSTWPFSGMPWGRLAFGVVDTPLAPALGYVAMTGVSFIVALLGFLVLQLVLTLRGRGAGRAAAVSGAVLVGALGIALLPALAPYRLQETDQATVAVVQGDVPGPGNDILYDFRQVTQNHVDATVAYAQQVERGEREQPDFVVWPENSTAVDPFTDASTNADINTAAQAVGAPIMVGAIVDAGPDHVLNQGIVWDPVTGGGERYTKRNPVPYGEYIPFRKYLDGTFGRLRMIPRDMLSGTRETPLEVADIAVADSICFDVAYDDGIYTQVRGGAELLTVQTSNASFIFTDQIDQQFAITRLRAIETGRPVAVAATNGISGIIAEDGTVLSAAEPRTQAVLSEQVPRMQGVTLGVRLGPLLGYLMWALALGGLALRVVTYRRETTTPKAEAGHPDPEPGQQSSDVRHLAGDGAVPGQPLGQPLGSDVAMTRRTGQ